MAGPASRRHIHTSPIPRLGGVAIFLASAIVSGFAFRKTPAALLAVIPSAWMFAIGLLDDLVGIRASRKLLSQCIGATLLFALGFRIPLPFLHGALEPLFSFALTLAWSVLIMNAINLVDGLDGLASGATVCAAGAMLLTALRFNQTDTAILASVLIGATAGFLKFNAYPASIFLGDSGSLVLGTIFAAISLRLMQATPYAVIVSVIALAHPFGEVITSTSRRALTAKPVFRPDRRHFHHRLLDRRLTHQRSSQLLVAISVIFALLATLASCGGIHAAIATCLSIVCAAYSFRAFRYREFRYLANLRRKLLYHRYAIEAHVQLGDICEKVEETRSLADLRSLLDQTFVPIGFTAANLHIVELDGLWRAVTRGRGMELSFPLESRRGNLGSLVLTWDLIAPPPLEIDVFQAEFLPVLARTVSAHVSRHREMKFAEPANKTGPVLVPAGMQRTGKSPTLVPLN
jgi:UDP-GlcNAc:undecaprenyl-phosphate GlcNAc-1-phosphate transferase